MPIELQEEYQEMLWRKRSPDWVPFNEKEEERWQFLRAQWDRLQESEKRKKQRLSKGKTPDSRADSPEGPFEKNPKPGHYLGEELGEEQEELEELEEELEELEELEQEAAAASAASCSPASCAVASAKAVPG